MIRPVLPVVAAVLLLATPAAAQVPGFSVSKQFKLDRLTETHWRAAGQVEMEQDDQRFFADTVDYYSDTGRLEASGNVVFTSRDGRISADRIEFDTRTRTGIFHNASGSASLGQPTEKDIFGTQEADAYFYGETIEKLGPAKYSITRGGFTTCLQPTPRWEMVASRATITLDEYAVLHNPVLRVKGVPLLYVPVLYYPINDEDRATGFLIPTYGNSTVRGHTLSNAFFWAINRSQDATFYHDWFSKTGQGLGGEYRYVLAPGADGQARVYWLDEDETTYDSGAGLVTQPARRSYEIRASAQQPLPFGLRARANVDYFSDITVQQLYHGGLYDASRRQRLYGGNLAGAWGVNRVSATLQRNEIFYGAADSQVYGNMPRLSYDRAARRIGASPVYLAATAEYVNSLRETRVGTSVFDQGLGRLGVRPVVSAPISRWPFLKINTSAAFEATWYSESLDALGRQVETPLWRNFFDLRADAVGPTVSRVWNTPDNGYAEKFKHIVEPNVGIQRVTLIENYDEIVKLETSDFTLGGTTRLSYGLTNRFLAKRRAGRGQAREFVNVTVSQSYYSDPRASQYDPSYGTSFGGRAPSSFSPIAVGARVSPADNINAGLRLEYDYQERLLQTFRFNGAYSLDERLQVNGGWSQRRFSFDRERLDNTMNLGGTTRWFQNRVGGTYQFDYDLGRDRLLQQRILAYYNPQCCGVAVEFQRYNYPVFDPRFPVPADTRFNISFTLAGIGTFSNPFGSFGGGTSGRAY
jgi:LPS-assembly protein